MEARIGIDMGGTRIKMGLVNEGKIWVSKKIEASAHMSLKDRLVEIKKEVDGILSENNISPTGIGIAFPGIVDSNQDKILSRYVKYPDAQRVDIHKWAWDNWEIPLKLENDARAALIGEWQYGAGKNCDNLVLITLGTGVGSAVLINGQMLRGKHFLAGNLGGHMTINIHGTHCNCGNIGCLESESSTWVLQHKVTNSPLFQTSTLSLEEEINFNVLFKRANQGDELAIQVRESCLKAWSVGVINLLHAYDPERIIIGGGIMKSKDIIIPYIKEMIGKYSWIQKDEIEVTSAEQIENAGILGVCHLLNH